jgi:hypothetical protein
MANVVENSVENPLEFLSTETVAQFKATKQIETIHVKKNPETGSFFFTYGLNRGDVGAISKSFTPEVGMTNPVISLVKDAENAEAEPFYLLHEQGAGLEDVATF